jgi:hypothetical protein
MQILEKRELYSVEKKLYLTPAESKAIQEAFPGEKFTRITRRALKLLIAQSKTDQRSAM